MKKPMYIAIEVQLRDDAQVDDDGYKLPFCNNDMWSGTLNPESNRIIGWPEGEEWNVYDKVGDSGFYYLLDENQDVIASIEGDYVPNKCIPGKYGDYIDLEISAEGVVTNMIRNPDFSEFFKEENDGN